MQGTPEPLCDNSGLRFNQLHPRSCYLHLPDRCTPRFERGPGEMKQKHRGVVFNHYLRSVSHYSFHTFLMAVSITARRGDSGSANEEKISSLTRSCKAA